MPATPKASSGLPRDQGSRRGITLLEVLISIGILAIGLTCVLGLIVAGRTSAARSIVYDQIGTVTENARADALTLGLTRLDALTSPTGGDCPAPPLIFDPIGLAAGVWPAASGLHPAVLRAAGPLSAPDTASAQPRAFPIAGYAFETRDDLASTAPSNDDDLPRNQFTAGVRSFYGRTTWLALLTHPFTTPLEPSQQATLTIIVCHKREPGVMPPPAGVLPPDLRLKAADRLEWSTGTLVAGRADKEVVRVGAWLLLAGTTVDPVVPPKVHRLVQADLDRAGGGATVAFEGNPRFDATTLPRNAYLLPDAISATEYTVTMQGADEYAR
jgi:Prokaryotic N-terminal methylation motif